MTGISDIRENIKVFESYVTKNLGSYGIVNNIKFSMKPNFAGRDYMGRPQLNGFWAVITWNMMQNGQDELNVVADDVSADAYESLKVVGMPSKLDGASITFSDVKPSYELDYNSADGGQSYIKCRAERAYTIDEFVTLFNVPAP